MYVCVMAEDKDNKTVNINFRVSEKLKDDLDKLATEDRRSLSDYIRLKLEELVKSLKKK